MNLGRVTFNGSSSEHAQQKIAPDNTSKNELQFLQRAALRFRGKSVEIGCNSGSPCQTVNGDKFFVDYYKKTYLW
jgi:hypothetical protein